MFGACLLDVIPFNTETHCHKSNHDSPDDCIDKLTVVEIKILGSTTEKYHDLNQGILVL